MDGKKSQPFEAIDAEIAEIDADVARRLERKRHLMMLRSKVWAEKCLRPDDRITEKNAKKFEILGSVMFVLWTAEPARRAKGLSTHELFQRAAHDGVNYATFRSYLNRFRKEERLAYDDLNGFWLPHRVKESRAESN